MPSALARWLDELALAGKGLLLATRERCFWLPFVVTFVVFGTLINLLSNGFASFQLMFASDFAGAMRILWSAVLGIFGVGKTFGDWLLNFALTVMQAVLIALVVFVARYNSKTKRRKASDAERSDVAMGSVESSAIVAGLAVLGSGCPTCGTTLLAPVLGAVLSGSTGAVALAGRLSLALNIVAMLLAVVVFQKVGFEAYAIIKSEHFTKKEGNHAKSH